MNNSLAVLSDIHGNVLALQAVLADARRRGVRRFVNLGDICYGPLWPAETLSLLNTVDVIATLQGNQDRDLYEADKLQLAKNATLESTVRSVGDAGLAWMAALPRTLQLEPALFLCHGTPASDLQYLLEDICSGQAVLRAAAAIAADLEGIKADLILCGHTHLPRVVRLDDGRLVVNPGSVGLPAYDDALPIPHAMQTGSPLACYALVEHGPSGWTVQHVRVPYDHAAAAQRAAENGRSDWAGWLLSGRA